MSAPSGLEFTSLRVIGLPFFKDQKFDLSSSGLSLILGKNLDSSNQNPNGAGKSLFFSQLPELLLSEPIVGDRKDTIRKGKVVLEFSKSGRAYRISRSFSPREKLEIERDGVNLEYRELASAREAVRKLIPYGEAEVLSLLYLDSRVPHPLIRGSNTARRDFFMRFFRMHSAPLMRKVVKTELDKLNVASALLEETRVEIQSARAALDGKTSSELRRELAGVTKRLSLLEEKCKDYTRVATIRAGFSRTEALWKSLPLVGLTLESTKADIRETKKAIDLQLESIRQKLQQWEVHDTWVSTNHKTKAKLRMLQEQLPEGATGNSGETFEYWQEKIATYQTTLRASKRSLSELLEEVEECSEDNLSRLTEKEKRLGALLDKLATEKDRCPTCGGPYNNEHAAEEADRTRIALRKTRQVLKTLSSKAKSVQVRKTDLDSEIKTLESKLLKYQRWVELLSEYQRLERVVAEPDTPSRSKAELAKSLANTMEKLEILMKAADVIEAQKLWKALSEEEQALASGEDPTRQVLALYETQSTLKVEASKRSELETRLLQLKEKRASLKSKLAERPELELLYQAFSRQGVEALMIKALCARIEQQVNKYARLIFPEDYRFSFELETQFNILVTRKYGKREVVSDVRKLSGAESLLFSLVLLVSLLSFVPPKNRSNLLILDEPTATFGPEMIEAFVKFLPILNSVIKHVVVITPLPYHKYEGANVWTVVKRGGQSTFNKTQVSKGG